MKLKYGILMFFMIVFQLSFGQCNFNTNKVYGVVVRQFEPSLIAYDDNYQIGMALGNVEKDLILTVVVRFKSSAKRIGSNLLVFTHGKEAVDLELIASQKDYLDDSEISLTKYKIEINQIQLLKENYLKTLRFRFENEDIMRTFEVQRNNAVLSEQIKCFTFN